jgi:hypothetical protein
MVKRGSFVLGIVFGLSLAAPAWGKTWKVPRDYPTIQGAVDAAAAGDEIEVGKGRHCGATINKRLSLTASRHGDVTIVGCATSPIIGPGLRVGFLLPGAPGAGTASGSKIRGFDFDGKGVSSRNLNPLAFGVFARFNDEVVVEDNDFCGTAQAITNTAGDRWSISDNEIDDLTLFDCSSAALCGGGVGIAVQLASAAIGAPGGAGNPLNRPEANAVVENQIEGRAPHGFAAFGMDGIFVFAADGIDLVENHTQIKAGASGTNLGVGILVSNTCCADPTEQLPGARYISLIKNRDHSSDGIVVEGSGGANTQGLVLFKNACHVTVEGAAALPTFAPQGLTDAPVFAGPQRIRFE